MVRSFGFLCCWRRLAGEYEEAGSGDFYAGECMLRTSAGGGEPSIGDSIMGYTDPGDPWLSGALKLTAGASTETDFYALVEFDDPNVVPQVMYDGMTYRGF